MLIHKTPAGLSPRVIPSPPQSLNFFSNNMCGLFCLLDFSLIGGIRDQRVAGSICYLSANRRFQFYKRSQLLSARTTKRFPSSRCASAIQIVRPLESKAETPSDIFFFAQI